MYLNLKMPAPVWAGSPLAFARPDTCFSVGLMFEILKSDTKLGKKAILAIHPDGKEKFCDTIYPAKSIANTVPVAGEHLEWSAFHD